MTNKLDSLTDRLVQKMKLSQSPVPGFIMGLSGTDSCIAFELAYRAFEHLGRPERLLGVHYKEEMFRHTWFEDGVIPWMRNRYIGAQIIVRRPLGGNQDPQRWGDLHLRAKNSNVDDGVLTPYDEGQNYWVAGTINATEKLLGRYTILADAVSIQLVQNIWKSTVLELCGEIGLPQTAIDKARLPDCFCGRDELAASHIELIDDIIRFRVVPSEHPVELLDTLIAYVAEQKLDNSFRERIPYVI